MFSKAVRVTAFLLLVSFTLAHSQEAAKVEKLLAEVDEWVLTDTAKIMAYIDSASAVTTEMMEASKYWEPTVSELSFLLGIDYVTSPRIDNTGRIYFLMRITGESPALFYMDGPMGWPMQLTPNNWTQEGFTINRLAVHPSGDYLLVTVYKHGDEMDDIWYFSRDGKFRPLVESRTVSYSGIIFNDDNPDEFYLYTYDKKTINIARYTLSTSTLDTVYTEPGVFFATDYYKGKMPVIRRYSASESQLCMYDVSANKMTVLSDTAIFWGAGLTNDG